VNDAEETVMGWNDDQIDQLVRRSAPPPTSGTDEEITSLLRGLAADIVDDHRRSRSRPIVAVPRWRRRLVVPLAAGAVLLSVAAGFAVWHDSDSAAFEKSVEDHTARLELPPGIDRAAYVAQLREQGRERPVTLSEQSVKSMSSHYAVCAWLTAWDRRHAAGDRSGSAEAVTALRRAVEAPALAANDGGGVVANLQKVAAAAAAGDRPPVQRELAANCATLPLDGVR
jgi:hypothetical protein